MNTPKISSLIALACVILALGNLPSNAYEIDTHETIATKAVAESSLVKTSYLREQLGFSLGPNELFRGQTAARWIVLGAQMEDDPDNRVRFHFHDPLRPWDQSLLSFLGIRIGGSSVRWNQEPRQDSNLLTGRGSWSWQNARKQFLDALMQGTKSDRDGAFADLFRSLGQGTHLLQDATLPAHVRSDLHLTLPYIPWKLPDPDGYEQWAHHSLATAALSINSTPIAPHTSIFTTTNDSKATAPVANLFDTERYNGSISSVLSDPAIGIAEFTNGSFLSKDTIFKNYNFPNKSVLDLTGPGAILPTPLPDTGMGRYFAGFIPTGERVSRFVREGALYKSLQAALAAPPPSSGWVLDDHVYEDYGRFLLPRAVGYSAAYLDYFFRGKLEFDVIDGENPTDSRQVRLEGKNASLEKLDGGTLELYGEDAQGVRTAATPIGSTTVTADPTQPISATFRLPPNTDKLMAVYMGKLGNEVPSTDFVGAVIGKSLRLEKVEQIFTDFTRWYLRSPEGVFPLPLLKSDVDDLQWGDDNNMLVGRSSVGSGEPNMFYTYRIDRQPGATNIPLSGTPLALIRVDLSSGNLGFATFPSRTLGENGNNVAAHPKLVDLPPVQVPFHLPEIGGIWMLVDVITGQVVANTAPSMLMVHHETGRISYTPNPNQSITNTTWRSMGSAIINGGNNAGSTTSGGDVLFAQPTGLCSAPRLAAMNVVASRSVPSRFVSNNLTLNRSEIQQLEFPQPANSTATDVNFPINCGDAVQELPKGFRVTVASGPTFAPSILGEFGAGVVRTKPVDGTERLVFLMSQAQNNSIFNQKAKVVAWSPVPQRIDGVQQFNDEALHALTTASQEAGLFVSIANGGNQTRLVDFNAGTVTGFPNQLLFDYALLEPSHFYNTSDFKFHAKDTSLASTGSPRSLAPAPNGNPRGRYHWLKIGEPVN